MTDTDPLILVTNDDGVYAPGILALFEKMQSIGRAMIVAPEMDNSAASHSLTMRRPLRARKIKKDVIAIDGTPTDCVTIGVGKLLKKKPDLIVSGINPGPNLGDDIFYSGTVSAAVEGTMLGIPSFAVSLGSWEEPCHYETAAAVALNLARKILQAGLPRDTLVNVNVPNLPMAEISNYRFTRQGRRVYDDAIKETFDPWGNKHFWIGGGTPYWSEGDDTDAKAITAGNISITPLHLDLTNYEALITLKKEWKNNLL